MLNSNAQHSKSSGADLAIDPNRSWDKLLTFTGVRKIFGWLTAATFEVPLSEGRAGHMQAELPNGSGCYMVVLVEADRFVQLWRAPLSSHLDVATLDEHTWPNDYKYHDAVDGFSHGAENPVPLAQVSCGRATQDVVEYRRYMWLWKRKVLIGKRGDAFLSFTNGITRTIFLLTNGAKAFPVLCERNSAELLFDLAGYGECKPLALSSLR